MTTLQIVILAFAALIVFSLLSSVIIIKRFKIDMSMYWTVVDIVCNGHRKLYIFGTVVFIGTGVATLGYLFNSGLSFVDGSILYLKVYGAMTPFVIAWYVVMFKTKSNKE